MQLDFTVSSCSIFFIAASASPSCASWVSSGRCARYSGIGDCVEFHARLTRPTQVHQRELPCQHQHRRNIQRLPPVPQNKNQRSNLSSCHSMCSRLLCQCLLHQKSIINCPAPDGSRLSENAIFNVIFCRCHPNCINNECSSLYFGLSTQKRRIFQLQSFNSCI